MGPDSWHKRLCGKDKNGTSACPDISSGNAIEYEHQIELKQGVFTFGEGCAVQIVATPNYRVLSPFNFVEGFAILLEGKNVAKTKIKVTIPTGDTRGNKCIASRYRDRLSGANGSKRQFDLRPSQHFGINDIFCKFVYMGNSENMNHWKWGVFYYNPDDTRLLVKKRVGHTLTLNFANPKIYWLLLCAVIFGLLTVWILG